MINEKTIQILKEHHFPAPPWIRYPDMPLGCMGWRMGVGEDYLNNFQKYIDDIKLYQILFPIPITWNWVKEYDENLHPVENKIKNMMGGKHKLFTKDGKPTYKINYENLEDNVYYINDTVLDLRYEQAFHFALATYTTALEFIEEEKDDPLYEDKKYTLCLNANYSKIVTDKKMIDSLIKTDDKILLYEDEDRYWGVHVENENITGENMQGLALMQIRDDIRKVYRNYDIIDWEVSYKI